MKFNASPKLSNGNIVNSNGNIVNSNGNSIKKKKKKLLQELKDK
tara:strand:- start:34 stop:165 length:132 start_codon:yes stop_codon:yes gene_type:complete